MLTSADLTSNVTTSAEHIVTGDGMFDDLMETATAHIEAQYQLGRITGSDYATVYLGTMQAIVQQAVQYTIGQAKTNAETDLLDQKCVTEFAQTDQTTKIPPSPTSIMGTQAALSIEQAKGFKWNADQKYLKTIFDAWSINISTAGVAATGVDAINEVGTPNINSIIDDTKPVG